MNYDELANKLDELGRLNREIKQRITRTETIRGDLLRHLKDAGDARIDVGPFRIEKKRRVTYSIAGLQPLAELVTKVQFEGLFKPTVDSGAVGKLLSSDRRAAVVNIVGDAVTKDTEFVVVRREKERTVPSESAVPAAQSVMPRTRRPVVSTNPKRWKPTYNPIGGWRDKLDPNQPDVL